MRVVERRFAFGAVVMAVALAGMGCKKDGDKGGGGGSENLPRAAVLEAQDIFKSRCVSCHGEKGKGDGPASATLTPKPRDLTLAEWQKSVSDEHIEKIILGGGGAVGKNVAMPPNPDLERKPLVVKALRAHVRSLSGK